MKKFILGILISLTLGIWSIFAQNNILPDEAVIEVDETIYENEYTNVKITMMKNWTKMNQYNSTIEIKITDESWTELTSNECTIPGNGFYKFVDSDLWSKEFQKWLTIKKEWIFYIEVSDLHDDDWKTIWKQKIKVIRNDGWNKTYHIDIITPDPEQQFTNWKLDIMASVPELPNSPAQIYIDEWTPTKVDTDYMWSITRTIWNIPTWKHTLHIEILNMDWSVKWESDKITFIMGDDSNSWIKDVKVYPEDWLIVGDQTTITVYADEMVEAIKLKLSDRTNNNMIMGKEAVWEFRYNVFLEKGGRISIDLETSASNNSVNNTYKNVKEFYVAEQPEIGEIRTDVKTEDQTATVSWEVLNGDPVSSYKLNYRAWDWSEIYWEEETTEQSKKFVDVPYDTTINVSITPIRKNALGVSTHWSAPKTVQFVIQKTDTCWNWTIDPGEDCSNCAMDLGDKCAILSGNTCWNWVIDPGEDCSTCARDLWDKCPITKAPRCTVQNIATRTTKIWDNYYLVRDKVENVTKYIVYSSTTPEWDDKVKVYETNDTNYEYPFDYNAQEDQFLYFWIVWICDDGEELELTWATKVQVWPAENLLLLICMTFLIYFGIKLFRATE